VAAPVAAGLLPATVDDEGDRHLTDLRMAKKLPSDSCGGDDDDDYDRDASFGDPYWTP